MKNCLERHGVEPTLHYTLSALGVRKRYHVDFDCNDAETVLGRIRKDLLDGVPADPDPLPVVPMVLPETGS